jgi:hypothetical protein
MARVTQQWLRTNHQIFSETFLDPRALALLIRKNVHKIDLGRAHKFEDPSKRVPDKVVLYKAGTHSRRFIVVLEGEATIFFHKVNMKFSVGPWESFGLEILRIVETHMSHYGKHMALFSLKTHFRDETSMLKAAEFVPDYDLVVTNSCKYLEVTAASYLNAFKVTNIVRTVKASSKTNSRTGLNRSSANSSARTLDISREHLLSALDDEYIKKRGVSTIDAPFRRQ